VTRHQTPLGRLAQPQLYADLLAELERRRRVADAAVVRGMIVVPPRS